MDERDFRMPLPSEDEGDLVEDPPEGMTDDPIVATEEGVPWDPPLDVVEALRASDVVAGDHLLVAVGGGSTVVLSGRVESVDVLDEILGIVGDVPGVEDVVDQVEVEGV